MAVTGGVSERFGSGAPRITMTAGAAVVAGRFVELTGDRTIGPAPAGSFKVIGLAIQDCDGVAATGNKVAVATGGVWNVRAGAAIAAGDQLVPLANGTVGPSGAAPDARTVVGIALQAIGNGNDGPALIGIGGS
jgi:hypothetical protein